MKPQVRFSVSYIPMQAKTNMHKLQNYANSKKFQGHGRPTLTYSSLTLPFNDKQFRLIYTVLQRA